MQVLDYKPTTIPFSILAGYNWEWWIEVFKKIEDSFVRKTEKDNVDWR